MKNDTIKSIVVLSAICLIVALLLSSLDIVTAPLIAKAEEEKENAAFLEVLPDAEELVPTPLPEGSSPLVIAVKKDTAGGGYAFKLIAESTYSGSPMTIIAGIGKDKKITRLSFIEYTDTPGIGSADGFNELFKGKDNTTPDKHTGATITTNAIKEALDAAYSVLEKISDEEGSLND